MTTDDREFWHATTDWLEAGSDQTPPEAVDAVLLAIRTTRQERALPRPLRPITMTLFARAAIAVAAVVVLALAWFKLAPSNADVGGVAPPAPTTSPIASPIAAATRSPATSPTPLPGPTPLPMPGGNSNPGPALVAGARYSSTDPFPVRLSFVAPAVWAGSEGGPYAVWAGPAATGDWISFELSPTVYADPCHPESGAVSIGSTASSLAQALVGRPGLVPTTPTTTTLGGRPATSVHLALKSAPKGCTDGAYVLWTLPLGATIGLQTGISERVWVLDTAAGPLVVTAEDRANATAAEQQAVQQALDSLQIAQ